MLWHDPILRFFTALLMVVLSVGVFIVDRTDDPLRGDRGELASEEERGTTTPPPRLRQYLSGTARAATRERGEEEQCLAGEIAVLMYHHIRPCDGTDGCREENTLAYGLSVDPQLFEEQMRYLHDRGYRTVLSEDLLSGSVPCKSFMITFDDGYENVYTNAAPVMEEFGFHGVFAIIVDRIGERGYMDTGQLKRLRDRGHEIASHTNAHRELPSLSDPEEFEEMATSKATLEEALKTKVISIVYPFGKYTKRSTSDAKRAGYAFGFTTRMGKASLRDNPFEMKRLRISNTLHRDLSKVFPPQRIAQAKNE